jgi:hypothetical protein
MPQQMAGGEFSHVEVEEVSRGRRLQSVVMTGFDPCIYNGRQSFSGSIWNGKEKCFTIGMTER